ncbi:MAG: glycosyltransferase family 2 protein [Acidimicrobiia bacterium]|nr:glycosyltransferase family 2 protein [Acidimicrobiia bacterium]NNF11452.1 glycosyltransferase family 2 protein [Acidimicrobiia bacterium]
MSPVSLVLVTHNSEAHIEASLGSLLGDPAGPDEIIVVDNASTDGTVGIVERLGVKLVSLDENHGFAYGCNLGASLTRGEVVAFLNPDTEPEHGWLTPLVDAIQRPGVGAAMPVMDLTYQRGHWFTSRSALTYLGFAWSTDSGDPIPPDLAEIDVPFASGAAFVMKRSLFDHLGGFRDEYFLYLEDVDLGWRLRLMGLRSVQVPDSRVAHDYEFGRHERKMYYLERNRLRMVWANYESATLTLLAPALIMVEFAVLAAAIRHGWIDQKLQSYRGFWQLRSLLRQERARSHSIRTVGDAEILATMDAAFDGINQFEIHPIVRALNRLAVGYLRVVQRLVA